MESPAIRDLIHQARDNAKQWYLAELKSVARGEWSKATECANRRMQETERAQLLMKHSAEQEVV